MHRHDLRPPSSMAFAVHYGEQREGRCHAGLRPAGRFMFSG